MTTRYVDGVAGNDGNNGLAPVFDGVNGPKLTLNGAEDTPVVAGDLVHIKAGAYRETLTVDVSGGAGSPVEYRGDYAGSIWSGAGGVVRITGSDNDQTAVRASCIVATTKNYRTFNGFAMDTCSSYLLNLTDPQNWIINGVHLHNLTAAIAGNCLRIAGANQLAVALTNSVVAPGLANQYQVNFTHAVAVNNTGHVISNCIMQHGGYTTGPIYSDKIGGITVKNSGFHGGQYGILALNLAAGQAVTVNNCLVQSAGNGLWAGVLGMVVEDFNTIAGCTTPRVNVAVGANSNVIPPLFDTRWFFEMVNGGNMVTPFDLGAWSQLINVAGTNPPATDMRGTGAIGGVREWGPLEYDPSLALTDIDGCDYPLPEDVENGIVYGSGAYTGTLVCPSGGGARPGCRWPDYKRRFDI